jgi:hypothetical protein
MVDLEHLVAITERQEGKIEGNQTEMKPTIKVSQ